jgi:hypothetical protein
VNLAKADLWDLLCIAEISQGVAEQHRGLNQLRFAIRVAMVVGRDNPRPR